MTPLNAAAPGRQAVLARPETKIVGHSNAPGVSVAITVVITLGAMAIHGVAAGSSTGRTVTAIAVLLLLAWLPLLVRPRAHPEAAIAVAALGAVTAAVGAVLYTGTGASALYWNAVLLLGLGALMQPLVRTPEVRRD